MIKKINLFLIIFTIIYSLYYFAVPAVINSDTNKSFIKSVIKNQSGIDLDYKNTKIKMGFLPSVIFYADEITVSDGLLLKDTTVKLNLLPLIYKTIDVKKFSCEKLVADIKIDEKGNLYLGKFLIKPVKTDFKAKLNNTKLYNFNINLDDEFNKKQISLNGKHFTLKDDESLFISVLGDIKVNNKISGINFDIESPNKNDFNNIKIQGQLTEFDLSELSPYISKLSNENIEKISGIINIQAQTDGDNVLANISSEKFSLNIKDIEKPVYLNNKTLINANLKIKNNALLISDLRVISKDLKAEITGKIEDIKSKFPKYNINLKLSDTLSENLLPLIPYIDFPQVDIKLKKLRDYGIYGLVNGQVTIEGNDDKPNLTGSFTATDVYVQKPLNIPKAIIKLDFKDKKCFFDAFAPASKTENVTVKGNVELYDKKIAEIDIKSTPNVSLKIAQTILNPLHEILDFEIGPVPIMDIYGIGNIDLKVYGNKQDPHLFGVFNFKNGTVSFNDVNAVIKNASGKLLFQDENMHFVSHYATLNGAPVKVEGNCSTQGVLNFNVISNGQSLNEAVKILNSSPMLSYMNNLTKPISATSGKINLLINLKGKMKHIEEFELGKTVTASGNIKLLNNNVIIGKSIFTVKNILGTIDFDNKDVNFNLTPVIGGQKINLNGKIKDNKIYSKNKFNNLSVKIKDSVVLLKNGEINFEGDKIILKKINSEIDSKPTIIDGYVLNIFDKPKADLYISSYMTQQFIDKYLNKKMIYPVILKGNTNYFTRLSGTLNSLKINGAVNMEKGSSIYYKGAIADATQNPLRLNFDCLVSAENQSINVKNLLYSKLDEQNKVIPVLSVNGSMKLKNKNIYFDNFKIKTQNSADARLFNIVFKKPHIKEGNFTSDLILNGNLNSPSALGNFHLFGVNIPFLDTTIKDISIAFRHTNADIKLKGEILSNEITFNANVKNSLNPPYVINNADLFLGNFNVNTFLKHLNRISIEDVDNKTDTSSMYEFNIKDLVIKNLKITAKSVYVRNLFSTNVKATISLINGLFKLDNLNFVTAEGTISGKMLYNFSNSIMNLSLILDEINANTISDALFDINNQFFGNLSGEANLTCVGKSHGECMKTLSGNCNFSVLNGRMPKLGSLEYLLKSSNVIKSGITGLTLNNVIEILTPLKTGNFESIKGKFSISKGITKDINIASKGKDLSIFIAGEYNFSSADAGLEVYGRLAKNVSNALGVVGNMSLNTLFNTLPGVNLSKTNKAEFVQIINKIPGIELNTNEYRIFFVKIDGNINTEDYHQIFKWID